VPQLVPAFASRDSSSREIPKSPSFKMPFLVMKMFYVLMSLCRIFLACITITAIVICATYYKIISGENLAPLTIFLEISELKAP
jgi:hypothetical protein